MGYTFTQQERLKSKKTIGILFKKGSVLFSYPLKAAYMKGNGLDCNRIMVSVPKRLFKRAVKRNLLKRRMREGYRLNKNLLPATGESGGYDIIFIYTIKEALGSKTIHESIIEILKRISDEDPDRSSQLL